MSHLASHALPLRRLAIRVRGQVQGVGFRPHVYRLAQSLQLTGCVRNDGDGVMIEVQGIEPHALVQQLQQSLPVLARIDQLEMNDISTCADEAGFSVNESIQNESHTLLPPDTAVCEDCLTELFDPRSRYYRYPFINCPHCGPRYTVVKKLPYDRPHTSLHEFPMCDACADEYHDMHARRFHAEATVCPACGPRLSHSIADIVEDIKAGKILAIKGLGGFHLVCDATNQAAVTSLRQRKQRDAKPFALMVANIESARQLVKLDDAAIALLSSPQRPVVVLDKLKHSHTVLADAIAPGLKQLGIMLPYTPLHYLLFHQAAAQPAGREWLQQVQDLTLVMTSANPHGEPLVIGNDEARQRLTQIADTIVDHEREIVTPVDDSVMQLVNETPQFIRRARGHVPMAIKLPMEVPTILAVGAHLKNTVCVTRGREAFVSQHVGSLDNPATVAHFEATIERLCDFLQVTPDIIAHDLHPDFISSRYAFAAGLKTEAIQHHHAHLAAVLAEQHIQEPVLGLVLDGYGMGDDGSAWGGELMLLQNADYQRLGHLKPLAQPGGEQAAREPWRMAASVMHALGRSDLITSRFREQALAPQVSMLLEQGLHCPPSSSGGRLFDAVSALLQICTHNRYEAEAAICLQQKVTKPELMRDGWRMCDNMLDLSPLLLRLLNEDAVTGTNLFHGTLIASLCDWVQQQAESQQLSTVLLSGGCFLNGILLQGVTTELQGHGLRVLTSHQLPVNDGGISLGQAWVAALRKRN